MSIQATEILLPYIAHPLSHLSRNYDVLFNKFRVLDTILKYDINVNSFHGTYKSLARSTYDVRLIMIAYYDICVLALNKWVLHKLKSKDSHIDAKTVRDIVEHMIATYQADKFDIILHKSLKFISNIVFHVSSHPAGVRTDKVLPDFEVTQNIGFLFHNTDIEVLPAHEYGQMFARVTNQLIDNYLDKKYDTFSLATFMVDYALLCKTMGIECVSVIDLFKTTFKIIHEYMDIYTKRILKSGTINYKVHVVQQKKQYIFGIMYKDNYKVNIKIGRARYDAKNRGNILLYYFGIEPHVFDKSCPRSEHIVNTQAKFTEIAKGILKRHLLSDNPKKLDIILLKTIEGRDFMYDYAVEVRGKQKFGPHVSEDKSISRKYRGKYGRMVDLEHLASVEYSPVEIPPFGLGVLNRCIRYILEYRELIMLSTVLNEYLPYIVREFDDHTSDVKKLLLADMHSCLVMPGWFGYKFINTLFSSHKIHDNIKGLLNCFIRVTSSNGKTIRELNRHLSLDNLLKQMFLNEDVFVTRSFVETVVKHTFDDLYSTDFGNDLHPFNRKFYRWQLQKFKIQRVSTLDRNGLHYFNDTLNQMNNAIDSAFGDVFHHSLNTGNNLDKYVRIIKQYESLHEFNDHTVTEVLYIRMYNDEDEEVPYQDDDNEEDFE